MYNYFSERAKTLKKIIERFRDLIYRKRLKKWFTVNIKLICRKTVRFLKSERLKTALTCTQALVGYVSVFVIALLSVGCVLFTNYACPYFNSDERILRRLTLTEYNTASPLLSTLDMLGSSNRIQITLKTDDENRFNTKGAGLDRGNINLQLTFANGDKSEYSLNNINYDNFESGMEDTFTIILPYDKTPFDITEYRLVAVPDINNKFDEWHCRWARVYFLLGNEPVMLAKESWDTVAVFGDGDTAIKQSVLEIVSENTTRYTRASILYGYFLKLKQTGMSDEQFSSLKTDTLSAVGLNAATVMNVNIETVNIEGQNNILTYYAKGVEIPDEDALDYDGMLYLDVTFYTRLEDGSYTKRYPLDTLGTDDFELGSTSSFRIEMPKGMTVFDISNMKIVADNPYDAWAPRFIRIYVDTDYKERLEIARITDTVLTATYSTPVFYKNLIDGGIEVDLTSAFCLSDAQKKALADKNGYNFGERISNMYYTLQSFYERQNTFFEEAVKIHLKTVSINDDKTTPVVKTETPQESENEESKEPEKDNTPDTTTNTDNSYTVPDGILTPQPVTTPEPEPEPEPTPTPEPEPESEPEPTPTPEPEPEPEPETPSEEEDEVIPEGIPTLPDDEEQITDEAPIE